MPIRFPPLDGYGNALMTVELKALNERMKEELEKIGAKADEWSWELGAQPPIPFRDAMTAKVKAELERFVQAGLIEPIQDGDIQVDPMMGRLRIECKFTVTDKDPRIGFTSVLAWLPGGAADGEPPDEEPDVASKPRVERLDVPVQLGRFRYLDDC